MAWGRRKETVRIARLCFAVSWWGPRPWVLGGERRRAELQPGERVAGANGEEDGGEKRRNERDVRGAGGEADRAHAGAQPLLLERRTRCEEKQGPETVVVKTFS